MSGATVVEFLAYWQNEGDAYVRRGDYEWMAAQVPGQRVLEIGCGLGFGLSLGGGFSICGGFGICLCLRCCFCFGLSLCSSFSICGSFVFHILQLFFCFCYIFSSIFFFIGIGCTTCKQGC